MNMRLFECISDEIWNVGSGPLKHEIVTYDRDYKEDKNYMQFTEYSYAYLKIHFREITQETNFTLSDLQP